jgi:hypothetical protein
MSFIIEFAFWYEYVRPRRELQSQTELLVSERTQSHIEGVRAGSIIENMLCVN